MNDAAVTRPQTFAQKALARAAGLDFVEIGQVVDARPDIVLNEAAEILADEVDLIRGNVKLAALFLLAEPTASSVE